WPAGLRRELAAVEIEMAEGDFFLGTESRVQALQHPQQPGDGSAGGVVLESEIGFGDRGESSQFRVQLDRRGQASVAQLQPGMRRFMPLAAAPHRRVASVIEDGSVEGKHWWVQ